MIKDSNQGQQIYANIIIINPPYQSYVITEPSFYPTRASFRHFVVSRIFFGIQRSREPSTWFGCTDRSWTRCPGALNEFWCVKTDRTPLGHWKYQMKYQMISGHFGLLEWSVHNIWLLREPAANPTKSSPPWEIASRSSEKSVNAAGATIPDYSIPYHRNKMAQRFSIGFHCFWKIMEHLLFLCLHRPRSSIAICSHDNKPSKP